MTPRGIRTTPTYRRFTVDAVVRLVSPFFTYKSLAFSAWAAGCYFATDRNAGWQTALSKLNGSSYKVGLQEVWALLRSALETSRILQVYSGILVFKAVNSVGQRIFVDRMASREIKWSDHIVVATGGAAGIAGRACQFFASKGAKVVVLDMAPKSEHGTEHLYIKVDVTNDEQMIAARAQIEKDVGMCTIVLASAGTARPGALLDDPVEYPLGRERLPVDVNLTGLMSTVRTFGSYMVNDPLSKVASNKVARNGWGGHIVLLGSMAGYMDLPLNISYHASKAGVSAVQSGLIHELDYWYKTNRVRVSAICPLKVETALTIGNMADTSSQFWVPTLHVDEVAQKIVDVVEADKSRVVFMPSGAYVLSFGRFFAPWVMRMVMKYSGSDSTFRDFITKLRVLGGKEEAFAYTQGAGRGAP